MSDGRSSGRQVRFGKVREVQSKYVYEDPLDEWSGSFDGKEVRALRVR